MRNEREIIEKNVTFDIRRKYLKVSDGDIYNGQQYVWRYIMVLFDYSEWAKDVMKSGECGEITLPSKKPDYLR